MILSHTGREVTLLKDSNFFLQACNPYQWQAIWNEKRSCAKERHGNLATVTEIILLLQEKYEMLPHYLLGYSLRNRVRSSFVLGIHSWRLRIIWNLGNFGLIFNPE